MTERSVFGSEQEHIYGQTNLYPKRRTLVLEGLMDNEGFVKAVILLFDKRNELSLILLSLHGVTSKSRAGGLREA